MTAPHSLLELLERVEPGEESFAPIALVPAFLLISPLSGIPGTVVLALCWLTGAG